MRRRVWVSKCSEEEFTSQFIGKTLPVKLGEDVDAVSGATITSTVVVDALNSLAVLPEAEATATPEPRATREPAEKAAYTKDAPKAQTGDFTVVGKGFGGDVTVKVTLDAGQVVTLAVEADKRRRVLGQKCADEEFHLSVHRQGASREAWRGRRRGKRCDDHLHGSRRRAERVDEVKNDRNMRGGGALHARASPYAAPLPGKTTVGRLWGERRLL